MDANETTLKFNWKDRTILIVENIDFTFLYLESILRRTGAKILWGQNGREAIDFFKSKSIDIDIVLMDIYIPIMDGYEATGLITKVCPNIPIIAMISSTEDREKSLSVGCVGCLQKPIRKEQLFDILAEQFKILDQRN